MADLLEDVWGSDESDQNAVMSDLNKVREHHSKRGYLDGIVSAKEVNLQEGFNDGFPNGSQLGFHIGQILGNLQFLSSVYADLDQQLLKDYKLAQHELNISNVLNKKLFNENYDIIVSDDDETSKDKCNNIYQHSLLKKWLNILESYRDKYNEQSKH